MKNQFFWSVIESDLGNITIPNHIKRAMDFGGFSSPIILQNCTREDISQIEKLMREKAYAVLKDKFTGEDLKKEIVNTFGDAHCLSPDEFAFLTGDKKYIEKAIAHVQKVFLEKGDKDGILHFQEAKSASTVVETTVTGHKSSDIHNQYFLNELIETAKVNEPRESGGHRFGSHIKKFALYLRLIAGPLAYETLQRNLPKSLPSLSSTNRYINIGFHMNEGEGRFDELHAYLIERKLPLMVSLSEDGTKITGRIQYDSRTNQIIGFTLPLDETTGVPKRGSFKARNIEEMLHHFSADNPISNNVIVIMAQPLANVPPFCLMFFGTDDKYTSNDVVKRWKYIIKCLSARNIHVLAVCSDSHPTYNSAMKTLSRIGKKSSIIESDWFCADVPLNEKSFCVQDLVHIGTKMRNFFLRTSYKHQKLPFVPNRFINLTHLYDLLEKYSKDKHQLTMSILNPIDRQNFESVLRMCDKKVTSLLTSSINNSEATVFFLETIRDILDSYMNPDLEPLERVRMLWYRIFVIRFWRRYILKKKNYSLKDNFLTSNCYSCIEINGHSLIGIILYLRSVNKPELFLPSLFGSQQCEKIFRKWRSFTPTYSTIASCSVKEMLGRVSKIEMQDEIIHSTSSVFIYPRLGTKYNELKTFELPSVDDIYKTIENCKSQAIETASKFKLLSKKDLSDPHLFACKVRPANDRKTAAKMKNETKSNSNSFTITKQLTQSDLANITLKNFPTKTDIDESSPFIELFFGPNKRRVVVKKSSLCWLLRKDWQKVSSDRLQRVQCTSTIAKKYKLRRLNKNHSGYKSMY